MNIIRLTTREQLNELENGSAFTLEGLAEESIPDLLEWVKQYTPLIKEDVYVTKGPTINEIYHLTGDNAYPDDCTLVSIKLDDMEHYEKIVIPRFQIGGRWFDDIVDNNARREGYKEDSI